MPATRLRMKTAPQTELAKTDTQMARVVEDLLTLLESRGVVKASMLPQKAQDLLAKRKALRAKP